ncbi:glycosyltransferase [Cyanobium sp. NIES-981]|uniref:glycosyltransferase n=1 Tax=Cyanobium sp. NIES-981 TaxID=1851505 RepID=UPI0012F7926E|nr:glycosyltransferase [Cyanobium sp. NIES-981]
MTVANERFLPGLKGLLLSLVAIYPDLSSPCIVFHDGTLTDTHLLELQSIYNEVCLHVPSPSWADALPLDSPNRARIGLLGYLNTYAFSLAGYERVIVLDSDVLVLGALDPLWAPGETFRAVMDCGARPYGLISEHTGLPVINSGVISIPGWALGDLFLDRVHTLVRSAAIPVCPLLDGFADQKVWNQLLADQPLEMMPVNYNCNIKYVVQFLDGCVEGLSLIHFAGPKPWLSDQLSRPRSKSITDHWLWHRHYRKLLSTELLRQYQAYLDTHSYLDRHTTAATGSSSESAGPSCSTARAVLACDPASLIPMDSASLSLHLILHSADQFGFDGGVSPRWPEHWLSSLATLARAFHDQRQPLSIWAPFELRHLLTQLPAPLPSTYRYILMDPCFSAPDLLDEGGCAFVPWHGTSLDTMRRAVERRVPCSSFQWLD